MLKLDEIHPPFACFNLGHEGLGTAQTPGNLGLGQTGIQPRLSEALEKLPVLADVFPALQKPTSPR